ncbi:MAG: glycosyltransferase family 2 protein [Prolixibacteraceae bacterium]|jgi:glycosyltransferase involved in cell wall biosynthesis|nr:glycosyltransferase family 2 protein [Prolixibacteraceae bacterium]MBT5527750.1 glycosyltransferase family 2 protein [Cytophagia bacterium]MBT6764067.1 glycosyltransferase family 2 protein [Prolixibacteraceae bacterium]MBT6999321.1 glycosyltransferase family 2 protein [Prolixibacteraceae bacterium]MBT7396204.1 glycosyltransferase family 2 protein [Prolixibacteraceae bacterium]
MNISFSVCIPTYNGVKYIHKQLESILAQLSKNDEIIISDDHSTDDTIQIIEAFNDDRIRIIKNKKEQGVVNNMENALNHAKGDYIFMADQDDIWYKDKIAEMLPFLEKYDLVISDATVIDKNDTLMHPSFFVVNKSSRGLLRNWYRNSFLGCCMAFNRKVLNYVIPFPTGIAMHDIWIGLNIALRGDYYFLQKPLIHYRRHENNASPGHEKSGFTIWYMITYRLFMMFHVVKRALFLKFRN